MKIRIVATSVSLALMLAASASQAATVITQWNFNSPTPDANTGTGTTTPNIGSGLVSSVGGVNIGAFGSGAANGGSSDPAASDNSGLQTTGYAAQGSGNKSTGVRFAVSTAGYENVQISYDLRHSNTSSRYEQVQYTIDGSTFLDIGAPFDGNAGDTWFKGRMIDFSAVAGVSGNPNFAFQVLAAFAPATTAYAASNPTGSYATAGTWRFDMVTVSGDVAAPVPVPAAVWLFGSALAGLVGFVRRRG